MPNGGAQIHAMKMGCSGRVRAGRHEHGMAGGKAFADGRDA
jgi:hypothetical protein